MGAEDTVRSMSLIGTMAQDLEITQLDSWEESKMWRKGTQILDRDTKEKLPLALVSLWIDI